MKKTIFFFLCLILLFQAPYAWADSNETETINEKFGLPIVVYGETLSTEQRKLVMQSLDITDPSTVRELVVTAKDLVYYIDGDPHSNLYSSAKITRKNSGEGLTVVINTPENITEVTTDIYKNALLTAGIEDALVEVTSPLKVTGHSALVGIYKAYDEEGAGLNKEHTEVANEELELATELAKQEGLNQEVVSELLAEIKTQMAEQSPKTKEEIVKIIDEQLASHNIQLSEEDRQLLIDLFDKMRDLNINFDNVKSQLEDLSNAIQDKISEAIGDQNFLDTVAAFFKQLFEDIKSIFK
ncbi:DUF1002 domain-containing protein [Litchfieldia salsa]|uniref:Uncharacterized protein YpuA, DUF1002 family n=1 Tax=Litchfieldia salsa TaxID=930152 RepID=A0A1H0URB5_9BACI|nr:DUF1002 domain-containing protein [Litchfieldia salsa]SDP68498.1 Uncharacterized protein YpuA, DUF1002 family [Litchfieldia salsa]